MKKILIIDNSIYKTGAIVSILNFSNHLKNEFEFQFVLDKNSQIIELVEHQGYKVHKISFNELNKSLSTLWYLPSLFINTFKVHNLICLEHISIVHINDLHNQVGTALKLFFPQLKVVYHVRLMPKCFLGRFYAVFAKLIIWKADTIICVSESVRDYFRYVNKATTIFDGLADTTTNTEKVYSSDLSKQCNVLYLANYVSGKGHVHAIKALKIALNECPQLRLKMIGTVINKPKQQQYYRDLQTMISDESLEAYVSLNAASDEVEKEITQADIVLNLSESESFSMVCFEALNCGTPLIASDCGGPAELFEDGVSGILIPNKDANAAANALVYLASNSAIAAEMGRQGHIFVSQKFKANIAITELRYIYQSLIAK